MPKNVVTATLVALVTFSGSDAFGSSLLGYGSTQCALFNAIQKDGGVMVESIDSWTLGFLSGLNHAAASNGKPDNLRRQQPDRIGAYIRAYCESKADETVAQAVESYWLISSDK